MACGLPMMMKRKGTSRTVVSLAPNGALVCPLFFVALRTVVFDGALR